MVIRRFSAGAVAVAVFSTMGLLVASSAWAGNATKEEIDAGVKFYDGVKADADKQKAYCDVKQAIGMMTSGPGKFAEAQQKASAATKKLRPDFTKAQSLSTRLDMKSEDTKRYTAARHALDQSCP
jgi:hypothetical protein